MLTTILYVFNLRGMDSFGRCDKLLMNGRAAQKYLKDTPGAVSDIDVTQLRATLDRHVATVCASAAMDRESIESYALHLDQALRDILSVWLTKLSSARAA